ncbi:MAG: hypothetical protein IJX38_01170 [Clostridia bacterium]|nr:hypothetical protein [Clostridia bacterium]
MEAKTDFKLYYHRCDIVAGKKLTFYTKNKNGHKDGEYVGWYDYKRNTVRLYPAPGSRIYGKLPAHEIAAYQLRKE